jgi:hypothetical protein
MIQRNERRVQFPRDHLASVAAAHRDVTVQEAQAGYAVLRIVAIFKILRPSRSHYRPGHQKR